MTEQVAPSLALIATPAVCGAVHPEAKRLAAVDVLLAPCAETDLHEYHVWLAVPTVRQEYSLAEAEFGSHLLLCEAGCSVSTTTLCPEGGRLTDHALAAATAVRDAARGWL